MSVVGTHALTTAAVVRDELGGCGAEELAVIARLINAVSDAMQVCAGRKFYYEAGAVERVKSYGTESIVVRRTPIVSITQIDLINQDGTVAHTFDSTTYGADDLDTGVIYKSTLWPLTSRVGEGLSNVFTSHYGGGIRRTPIPGTERASIKVTFDGGWVTPQQAADDALLTRNLPYDLEEGCIRSVVRSFKNKNRDPDIITKTTEQVSTTWQDPTNASKVFVNSGILTAQTAAIAKQYWRGWL